MDYRKEYAREKAKEEKLTARLEAAQQDNTILERKLAGLKGGALWKASEPARDVYHWMQRTKDRVSNYGSPRGIARKVQSKMIEKKARLQHGLASFPTEEQRLEQEQTVWEKPVKISILTPLYNTPEKFLREMLDSVAAQTYGNWELCLADGSDEAHTSVGEICREYQARDPRFKYEHLKENTGISGNTNECLKMATGDYIGLLDHDDLLHPCVLFEYMKRISEEGADYLYCDEATFQGDRTVDDMITIHFKPDFAIDNLRANNYICHFSVFDRTLLDGMELFRSKFDGSQDHDMILRLTARAKHVCHVPKLMYYWRSHSGSTAADINSKSYAIEAARGAVADHLTSCGFRNFEIVSTRAFETIFRIKYEILKNVKVSIIIPNCDHEADLRRCIDSIRKLSTYDNYEILVVENNSQTPEIRAYYEELKLAGIRVLDYTKEHPEKTGFNFSALINYGVSKAEGDYVLLLNNDTEGISINWIEELLMYAARQTGDVAAVGAKLYYPDRTIQHAGIVLGLGAHRTAGHSHYRVAESNLGYMGRLCYSQDVSAVTGACLMVSRAKFEEVGGFDESFAVALNDVDFCLKLREKGYLNVWNPYCELYHYESASRGSDVQDAEKAERYNQESAHFREKWAEVLAKGDPYYNPNFSLDRSDYSLKLSERTTG